MSDSSRKDHDKAKALFEHFVESKMRIFLSTIVLSEYAMANNVQALLGLYQFEIINFSSADAMKAKDVNFIKYKKEATTPRSCLKDDFKILAQCIRSEVDYFAFYDEKLNKFIEKDREKLGIKFTPLYVPDGKAKHFGGSQSSIQFA